MRGASDQQFRPENKLISDFGQKKLPNSGIMLGNLMVFYSKLLLITRAATIQLPHDTIRIAIFASRYDMYRDTFLTT